MIIRYRKETGPDTYNEVELEGTLEEIAEFSRGMEFVTKFTTLLEGMLDV